MTQIAERERTSVNKARLSHFMDDGRAVFLLDSKPGREPLQMIVPTSQRPSFMERRTGELIGVKGGQFFVKADQPMDIVAHERVTLEVPTPHENGKARMYTFSKGELSIRNTHEGLLPHLLLSPELQPDGRYAYRSPEGNNFSFAVVESDQKPPSVFWRPRPGKETGEFFIPMGKEEELDAVTATVRTTVEMPINRLEKEGEREGPLVSVENGSFHVRVTRHNQTYIETIDSVGMVEARGEGIGREAIVVIPDHEDSFVANLYLRGHTYTQTHDTYKVWRTFPLRSVIGTVHVGNGRDIEFNNDRWHGYELGMQYDERQKMYVHRVYSLRELQKMERNHEFDRNRSGHEHVIKRKRKKEAVQVSDSSDSVVEVKDQEPSPVLHEVEGPETEKEWAIRQLEKQANLKKDLTSVYEPLPTKTEVRRRRKEEEKKRLHDASLRNPHSTIDLSSLREAKPEPVQQAGRNWWRRSRRQIETSVITQEDEVNRRRYVLETVTGGNVLEEVRKRLNQVLKSKIGPDSKRAREVLKLGEFLAHISTSSDNSIDKGEITVPTLATLNLLYEGKLSPSLGLMFREFAQNFDYMGDLLANSDRREQGFNMLTQISMLFREESEEKDQPELTDLDHRNIIPHMATALEASERTGKVTEQAGQLWPDWRTTELLIQRREAERHAQALGTLVQERVSNFLKLAEDPGSGYKLDTSSDGKTDQVRFEGEIIAQRTTNDNADLVFTLFTPDLRPRINGYPAVETDGNQTHVIYFPRTNFPHRNNAINESSMYINHVLTTYLPEPGAPLKHVPPPQR